MQDFKYIGIDVTLVDQMFFSTQEAKSDYIENIEQFLRELSIFKGDDRLAVLNKVGDADSDLPLLPDILAFSGDQQYSKLSETGKYYTDVKLCEYNIESKRDASVNDFEFEEGIFSRLLTVDLAGYARLNLTFQLGAVHALTNDSKRDYYFNLLKATSFDLSPATVSEFYKLIAQIYLDANNKESAISWLKAGIVLNPKLSVKKIIKNLEQQ